MQGRRFHEEIIICDSGGPRHQQEKRKVHDAAVLAEATGINRVLISRIEKQDFIPSIPQLEQLGEVLGFEPDSVFADTAHDRLPPRHRYALRLPAPATSVSPLPPCSLQHNHVTAVDILPEKVDLINRRKSSIQDDYIEKYLAEKDLDLTATLDGAAAYRDADYVIIAAPTNYDSARNYFDTSAVEAVIELVLSVNPDAVMVIKSTIPVGYTESVRQKYHTANIIFSPEFLRESKALYDNLYPSWIIVSTDSTTSALWSLQGNFAALCRRVPSRRISRRFSWDLPRRRPSSFSQTPIWRCACPISMSLTPMQRRKFKHTRHHRRRMSRPENRHALQQPVLPDTAVTVCRKTPNSFWLITMTFRRT